MNQYCRGEKIELTKELAIDCEFVRGLAGEREISLLARVSIVNANGKCIMDKFVKPTQKVVNYCTFVSGIRPCDLINGIYFFILFFIIFIRIIN